MKRTCRPLRQHGAALLTAMIIVALIATLAASMLWQQWRAVQVEAAERERTQSAWILAGALDWARLILREDGKASRGNPVDHLGEPWAVPLEEARLSSFLASDKGPIEDAPDAFLSGEISDATARYNLTNLVQGGQIVPIELTSLRNLCQSVGVNVDVADRIATGLKDATPPTPGVPAASGAAPRSPNPPLLPVWTHDLGWLGIDAESVRALEPYVVILPTQTYPNVNTASREVLAASIQGMDAGSAERVVQARQRAPLGNVKDLIALTGIDPAAVSRAMVSSEYFEVKGRLRLGQVVLEQRSIVHRNPGNNQVVVVRRERSPGRDTRDR